MSLAADTYKDIESQIEDYLRVVKGNHISDDLRNQYANSAIKLLQNLPTKTDYTPATEFIAMVESSSLVEWAFLQNKDKDIYWFLKDGISFFCPRYKSSADVFWLLEDNNLQSLEQKIKDLVSGSESSELVLVIRVLCQEADKFLRFFKEGISVDVRSNPSGASSLPKYTQSPLEKIECIIKNLQLIRLSASDAAKIDDASSKDIPLQIQRFFNKMMVDLIQCSVQSAEATDIVFLLYQAGANFEELLEGKSEIEPPLPEAWVPTHLPKVLDRIRNGDVSWGSVGYMLWRVAHRLLIDKNFSRAAHVINLLPPNVSAINSLHTNDQRNFLQRCIFMDISSPKILYNLINPLIDKGAELKFVGIIGVKSILALALEAYPQKLSFWIAKMKSENMSISDVLQCQDVIARRSRSEKETLLHIAAKQNMHADIDLMKVLLKEVPADKLKDCIDLLDSDGATALHHAVKKGNVQAVAALIEAGASIDAVNDAGFQALHLAAQSEDPSCAKIIELLLAGKQGQGAANIDAQTSSSKKDGRTLKKTAAHFAVKSKNTPVRNAIMAAHPNLNVEDLERHTPLDYLLTTYQEECDPSFRDRRYGFEGRFSDAAVKLVLEKIQQVLTVFPEAANRQTCRIGADDTDRTWCLPVHRLLLTSSTPSLSGALWEDVKNVILLYLEKTKFDRGHQNGNMAFIESKCLQIAINKNSEDLVCALLDKGFEVAMPLRDTPLAGTLWVELGLMFSNAIRLPSDDNPEILNRLLDTKNRAEDDVSFAARRRDMLQCILPTSENWLLHAAIINNKPIIAQSLLHRFSLNAADLCFILEAKKREGRTALELVDGRVRNAEENQAEWTRLRNQLAAHDASLRPARSKWALPQAILCGIILFVPWLLSCAFSSAGDERSVRSKLERRWEQLVTHALKPPFDPALWQAPDSAEAVPLHFVDDQGENASASNSRMVTTAEVTMQVNTTGISEVVAEDTSKRPGSSLK